MAVFMKKVDFIKRQSDEDDGCFNVMVNVHIVYITNNVHNVYIEKNKER